MSATLAPHTTWQIVGFNETANLVACGFAEPIVYDGERYFLYTPQSERPANAYARAEIEEFEREGRLTLLPSPQPFVENAVVLTVWEPFCEALEERFEDRPDWFALNDLAWATIQPAADVEKQMNAWGEKLLRKLALEMCRAFAETSTWEAVERIADFARYAARDIELRYHIFCLYGYTLLRFGQEKRFKRFFNFTMRHDKPELGWEAFQKKVESEVVRVLIDLAYGEQRTEYNAWDAMGVYCCLQGHYSESETLLNKALEVCRQSYSESHPEIALRLNNVAVLYRDQGRYSEAEPLYQQALAITKQSLPAGHLDIAISLNNVAVLYRDQGRYSEAEPLYLNALVIRQQSLPAGHPSIAGSLNNLGLLYYSQGRYEEAEPLYQQALAMRQQSLPAGHPDIATSLNNLAALYRAQGRYTESEPLYQQALAIDQKAYPENHPEIATDLNNLGVLYANMGNYAQARSHLEQALTIYENALPNNHPLLVSCQQSLQNVYASLAQQLSVKHIN